MILIIIPLEFVFLKIVEIFLICITLNLMNSYILHVLLLFWRNSFQIEKFQLTWTKRNFFTFTEKPLECILHPLFHLLMEKVTAKILQKLALLAHLNTTSNNTNNLTHSNQWGNMSWVVNDIRNLEYKVK